MRPKLRRALVNLGYLVTWIPLFFMVMIYLAVVALWHAARNIVGAEDDPPS